ncbi:MAG: T9SS type A sorting domain-containing protein, partial [Ferruginibacter sp.]
NAGYSYVWQPGSLAGATVNVTPATTTTYTVTASDNTGGPNTGCALKGSVTVSVNSAPTSLTVTPGSVTQCVNSAASLLTANGGILSNVAALNEDFNSSTNSWTVSNTSTGGPFPANAAWTLRPNGYIYNGFTFNSNDATQFYLSNSFSQGTGSITNTYLRSPAFSLSGYTTANLSFWHYYRYNSGETATVEASTDNTNWTPVAGGTYTSTQGSSNGFVNANLNMDSYAGQPVVYLRFVNQATWDWWWAVDNVKITGNVNTTVTWTQAPASPNSMFTDASASIPYITGADANSIYAFPGVTTVFTATATSPIAGNCKSTATSTITVVPPVSVTILASANPACPSANITFAATVVNGGPSPTFQWQVNGANVGSNLSTYSNNSLNSGDKVNVIVIGNGVCTFGNPASSDTITMSVAPPSGVGLSISVSPGNEVCAGAPVTFTATPTNGGLNPVYQWKINGVNAGTNSPTFVTSTLSNGDPVTCVVTSNSPCISGIPTAVSNQILMTINQPGPTAAVIGTTLGSNTVCTGTEVTVRATPTNQGHAPTYEFFLNNISQGVQASNDFIFTPVNGDKVKVRLVSNYACLVGTNSANSNTITMTVLASAPADVTLATSASQCTGTPITFTATPFNGGVGPNYEFLLNGTSVQNGTSNTYVLPVPANGNTVQVILTSTFGCATNNPASSAIFTVTLNAAPTASVGIDCPSIMGGSGQQATLTATATAGSGTIQSYQWILNGTTNVGTNSSTYTTNVAGSYTVKITNSNGCTFTTSATPVVLTVTTSALAAGTYVIPGTACNGFDKISSAVSYINANGISGAGGIIFNIAPGYSETAPVGGYALTATGTATNGITFQRNGSGNNPVITAGLQVAGSNNDGIFKLLGSDYITIKNLTLQENAGNTVTATGGTNTMTEWAVALLSATTTNGPSNNTIQNDSISLNKLYPNSFGIYSNLRHSAAAVGTNADLTNNTGGINKVYSNIISNVNNPVFFLAGGSMSNGNDIGGATAATANIITDWGSNNATNSGNLLFGVPVSITGIFAANQTGLNISWNTLTNATAINAGVAGLYGIHTDFVSSSPTGTFINSITNNSVLLSNAGLTGTFEAISQGNTFAGAAVPGFTLNLNNNITNAVLSGVGSASTITCIANYFPVGILNISDNIIKGNTSTATAGGFSGIVNSGSVATTITINNNQFGDATTDAVTFSAATNGAVQGISNTGAAPAAVLSMNGNLFTRFVHTVTGTSDHAYLSNSVPVATQNINTNNFTGIATNSNGTLTGISSAQSGTNKVISGNVFSSITNGFGAMSMIIASGGSNLCNINNNNLGNNISNSISGAGDVTGISLVSSGTVTVTSNIITGLSGIGSANSVITGVLSNAPTVTVTSNSINKFSSQGTGSAIHGIQVVSGSNVNASLNMIDTLTVTGTGSVSVSGITVTGGSVVNILKNKIYTLSAQNSTGGSGSLVNGLLLTGGTTITAYNNFVSDLKAPVANTTDGIRGISVPSTTVNSVYNIYYNSIYLNASSTGTNFGSSALFHSGNATATTAVLNLRNNILDNESVAAGTGLTVALRKGATELNNYAGSSNNNLFFAGSLAVPGPLYYDGINTETTISGLQVRLAARESASISAQPIFVGVIDLHLLTTDNCSIDGGAAPITGITDDIDADVRNTVTPDIGADEFNGTGGGIGNWKGVNTNWMDPVNWCNQIPTATTDVTIPSGKPFYPIITTSTPVSKSIAILSGATVTITGTGKLSIYGAISNAGTFDVADGTIELAGSTAQTIPANAFQNNDLKNLVISNSAAAPSVSLAGALNIYGKLSFTGNNKSFATNGNITLKSNVAGTASVGDLTSNNIANNNNQVTGDVTVERFIKAKRAWRFLSVPTLNNLQTIHEAWQENQAPNAPTPAGLGIQITSNLAGWSAAGFDLQSPGGPSMKTYDPASNSWIGIPTTLVPFETGAGYMTFIRGDRTVNTFGPPPTVTTLRDKGALKTYDFTAPSIGAGLFGALGNPYASAIDFTKLTKNNLQDVYYMWDPQMGTYGGYVTFAGPAYTPTTSISYNSGNNFIESGQAFFVHSSGSAGSLTFTENSKVDGSNLVTRINGANSQLRTNLYVTSGAEIHLYDAVITEFDGSYSRNVDVLDALKLVNFGENLGMVRDGKILSVERMPDIINTDTIFYNLAQLRVQNYQFEFVAENLQPGLTGFLEDSYLQTSTAIPMDGTTKINFAVNTELGSYALNRFRLVFKLIGPVPVTFTSIRANRQDRNIIVQWNVDNQLNIDHYDVERSGDGVNFTKIEEQAAHGYGSSTVSYSSIDTDPYQGDNFYRIRSTGIGNEIKFSEVVKVNMNRPVAISVFPNPVAADGLLYIKLDNKPAAVYHVKLVNSEGQTIYKTTLNHAGGNGIYMVKLGSLVAHGNYIITIADKEQKEDIKIVY